MIFFCSRRYRKYWKRIFKRRHFDDIDNITNNTTAALKAIPQNQFQNCFEGWTRHWKQCIASQREYFEGDDGGIQQWGRYHFYRDEFANFVIPRKPQHDAEPHKNTIVRTNRRQNKETCTFPCYLPSYNLTRSFQQALGLVLTVNYRFTNAAISLYSTIYATCFCHTFTIFSY